MFLYLVLATRVAQWLEGRAQRSDDLCVRGLNPTVGRGCRSFGCQRPYKLRFRVAVGVAR
jgi:hypothetical protein